MTTWPERICERCRIRSVGVTGSDPRLCATCAPPALSGRDLGDETDAIRPPCRPCAQVGRIEIAGRCPWHDGGAGDA